MSWSVTVLRLVAHTIHVPVVAASLTAPLPSEHGMARMAIVGLTHRSCIHGTGPSGTGSRFLAELERHFLDPVRSYALVPLNVRRCKS